MTFTDEVAKFSPGESFCSRDLQRRIIKSYREGYQHSYPEMESMWTSILSLNAAIHDGMLKNDVDPSILDNPSDTNMFYGFDNLFAQRVREIKDDPAVGEYYLASIRNVIMRLAAALGICRTPNPEGGALYPPHSTELASVEDVFDRVSDIMGVDLDFPNPFSNEFGIQTRRGLISERAVHAIYQAWRIKQLLGDINAPVLEIGAGLGRTAYYAHKMGVTDYTIIDLAFTNISQANFLGRVLSPDVVSLYGEKPKSIKIVPSSVLDQINFNLAVNVDSLPEMGPVAMDAYIKRIIECRALLWSVNHEANHVTVAQIRALKGRRLNRVPYWLRPGYVDETFSGRVLVGA
jgi:hypothetical protein